MRIGELLRRIPGLDKRFLYYLEAKGYITPELIQKKRLSRRDYSEDDVHAVQLAFHLYRRGYAPRVAIQLARREPFLVAGLTDSRLLSLGLHKAQELVVDHLGENQDGFIQIVPETQLLVIADQQPGAKDRYCLRVSLLAGNRQGPFLLVFQTGGSVVRTITTDQNGDALEAGLTDADVGELRRCDRVEVSALEEPSSTHRGDAISRPDAGLMETF
jgi:DNA-binding transcriptional MerR regulator